MLAYSSVRSNKFYFINTIFFYCRIIGIAHVEDLEGRPLAEVKCVDIGIRLLQQVEAITNKQHFLDCVFAK